VGWIGVPVETASEAITGAWISVLQSQLSTETLHQLIADDGSGPAATWEPSTLTVSPEGDDILDEIVISFASINAKKTPKGGEGPLGQIGDLLGSVGDLLSAGKN
jgi:hypothetical protein